MKAREREDQPMRDYAAFLRAVSPMNAKMPELKKCFEAAGFVDVKTLLSSGNLVFRARAASEASLERKCEATMNKHLGRAFLTVVRPLDTLRAILDRDPYKSFRLAPTAKIYTGRGRGSRGACRADAPRLERHGQGACSWSLRICARAMPQTPRAL